MAIRLVAQNFPADSRRSERCAPENLSRIHPVARIKNAFDLAHRAKQSIPHLFSYVFGACDTDAVFGRERTFELLHQRRGLIRDLAKFLQIGGIMKVEHRPLHATIRSPACP
jgi:hypothetical protein